MDGFKPTDGNFHLEDRRTLMMNSIDKRTNNYQKSRRFINLLEEIDSDGDFNSVRHQCLDCGEELKVIRI